MTFSIERCIGADHPSLAGHFPGNPIVPGVVLLDEVLDTLRAWRGPCELAAVPSVKFSAVLRPGQVFTITLNTRGEREMSFECRTQDARLIAKGQLNCVFHAAA
ncbi:MAG: hydroxymyristoyl-ACP dehydratase [Gammaproteobacteria bacterium]